MTRINLPFVQAFTARGKRYFYFRKPGCTRLRLPGLPGSTEFMEAYQKALTDKPAIGASRTEAGTINALVVAYYASNAWEAKSPDTRNDQRRIIERFRLEHGAKSVVALRREHIDRMLAAIDKTTSKQHWLMTIRSLLHAAVPLMRPDNPTDGIRIRRLKSKGYHRWTDAEIEQYRAYWPCGTQQRLVFDFALETYSRRGEVVLLGPQHVKAGRIRIKRTHGSKDVDIEVSPALAAAIDAMPKAHLTYITTQSGRPRSKGALGHEFARWATEAGLPMHCRMHGLKKAGLCQVIEGGGIPHEVMAVSGHRTLAMVQLYTEEVNQTKLADSAVRKRTEGEQPKSNMNRPAVKQVTKLVAKSLKQND